MNIDEAIKIQTQYEQELMLCLPTDKRVAIELGIEALKAVKYLRTIDYRVQAKQLPGETED